MEHMPSWTEALCRESAKKFTIGFVGKRDGTRYTGGLASEFFNYANRKVAQDPLMLTPVFKCAASTSLTANRHEFKTTKINRIVQASGADWRDALLVFTQFFIDYYGIDARIMLTIHDELRYIVADPDIPQFSYVLMLSHVYTIALFIDTLGLDLIPASKAWFEEIDVTQNLLKAWDKTGVCPEFPEGFPKGHGITAPDVLEYIYGGLVKV
jgi:DNA polymerase gamma 1